MTTNMTVKNPQQQPQQQQQQVIIQRRIQVVPFLLVLLVLARTVDGFGIQQQQQQQQQRKVITAFTATTSYLQQRKQQQQQQQKQHHPCSVIGASSTSSCSSLFAKRKQVDDNDDDDDDDIGTVGQGPNWIERSLPAGIKGISSSSSSRVVQKRAYKDDIDDDDDEDEDDDDSDDSSAVVQDYNLGISGASFGTGPLGKRMYDAIVTRNQQSMARGAAMSNEILRALTLCAMDFTAKEATRAALKQNGLDMALTPEQEEAGIGMWAGHVDSIRLLDATTNQPVSNKKLYDSLDEAVDDWIPGQGFDFIVRQVPAKMRPLDLSELLHALDPDGTLRKSAKEANMTLPDEDERNENDDDDDDDFDVFVDPIQSLQDLANESVRRSEQAPRPVETDRPYIGTSVGQQRGYRIIHQSDLLRENRNVDGTERHATLMHVMDALVSHGCLIVDVSNGGKNTENVKTLANMWQTVDTFYDQLLSQQQSQSENDDNNNNNNNFVLPGMTSVLDSPYAKVGYATYDNGSMQFLETRWERTTTTSMNHDDDIDDGSGGEKVSLWPMEAAQLLGDTGTLALKRAFDLVTDIGKNVVRIATAASSVEHQGFTTGQQRQPQQQPQQKAIKPSISGIPGLINNDEEEEGDDDDALVVVDETNAKVLASQAASLLADELVDDGKALPFAIATEIGVASHQEGRVSMSPHRICRYTDLRENKNNSNKKNNNNSNKQQREVFGAHTDSSFVTIVPVAALSGLEVYDEAAEQWLRPELLARRHWELEQRNTPDAAAAAALGVGEDKEEEEDENANAAATTSTTSLPWHARYVVIMPGEFLQIVTRNEVPAAVHRVVAAKEQARLSAPILLRGRPGTKLNVARYLGDNNGNNNPTTKKKKRNSPLLAQCNGMSMEQIHQAMQPSSFE